MLTLGSLFSGIGGLEMGLEASLGCRTMWQVEQKDFPRRVLAHRWPDVDRSVTDVCKATRFNLAPVDVICGGFPCQDLSPAGTRRGLSGSRSGLAFEFLRIVDEMQPRCVVVENTGHGWRAWVPKLRGALWAGGYASMPFRVRARDVGAPHIRARCFLVAYRLSLSDPDMRGCEDERKPSSAGRKGEPGVFVDGQRLEDAGAGGRIVGVVPNTDGADLRVSAGFDGRCATEPRHAGTSGDAADTCGEGRSMPKVEPRCGEAQLSPPLGTCWGPPPPAVRGMDDGFSKSVDRDRLTALGNAVVPQCAAVVGEIIKRMGILR